METVEVPYRHGYDFGISARLVTGSSMQLGVEGAISSVQLANAGDGSFSLTEVISTEDLEAKLGISANAEGRGGLFNASARFDFAKQAKFSATSLLLLLHATRTLGFQQIDQPSLNDEAAALVNAQKLELFDQRYGDSFVRGMLTQTQQ